MKKTRGIGVSRSADIQVKSNLILTARERGKIVTRREGHNIWLNLGREYLAQLIAYQSFSPLTPVRDDRVRYMGLGIGGSRQLVDDSNMASSVTTAYPGSNTQVDTDPTLTQLERPVRLSGLSDPYPGQGTDIWLGQVQAPPGHPTTTQTAFSRLFLANEVSYGSFTTVPLAEIGLFTAAANPNVYNNTMIAYDTFDTISKTVAFDLEVVWTIRF
jgi:hypothetical protein